MKQKTIYTESAKVVEFLKSCTITGSIGNQYNQYSLSNEDAPFLDQFLTFGSRELSS